MDNIYSDFSLTQKKKNLFVEKNSLAKVRDGVSEFKSNDTSELLSENIIAGHDATHPLISGLVESLGILKTSQASAVNESLVIGVGLSLIPEFKSDFRVMGMKSIQDEKNRMKFLFERRAFGNSDVDARSLKILLDIFVQARTLGRYLDTKSQSPFISNLREVYTLHKEWYYDSSDDQSFQISQCKVADDKKDLDLVIKSIVTKINEDIVKLSATVK